MITASIVLYKPNSNVHKAINSFLNLLSPLQLYLVDNSPDDSFIRSHEYLAKDNRVVYLFNNKNAGYGTAHNIAIKKAMDISPYHIVLNPDVEFDSKAIEECIHFMEQNKNIGLLMPKIIYPDGSTQYLCKMLPTPFDLVVRRFMPSFLQKLMQERLDKYELKHKDYDKIMEVPNLSGCFMFMRCSALKTIGLFDEKFFMYLEDTDLSRRINSQYQTIYFPKVSVIHHFEKGSYKNYKLLKYHIRSAFHYFTKWGWFFDQNRSTINTLLEK